MSILYLGAYESPETDHTGVDYIKFTRTHYKDPAKVYHQKDGYPLPSAKDDASTFVSPHPDPVPTNIYDGGKSSWEFSKASGIWTRGKKTWMPKFVLRVFSLDGKYVQQVYYGTSWKHFDKLVAKFDPNDQRTTYNYNKWRYDVLKAHQMGFEEEAPEVPWTERERVILRGLVNDYVEENGLISFANDLNWKDEVLGFNKASKVAGSDGPWRSEASILAQFGLDSEILKVFEHAQDLARSGVKVSRQVNFPQGIIPLHREARIEEVERERQTRTFDDEWPDMEN
ncbi:hypothetical protein FB567DRAFT_514894 [Paraphoma chrysanthemicola]|uniref:Uncharacterized protein n=1 Tax=Paraphoma chrysanthemicola TaxID=798071 RepID=A0A8K0RFR1_9PLEO|nr:hypothetical protein FB567DRAFT_514894 [Paraphoma chrysanthemicola]